jgi:hypothetical protein
MWSDAKANVNHSGSGARCGSSLASGNIYIYRCLSGIRTGRMLSNAVEYGRGVVVGGDTHNNWQVGIVYKLEKFWYRAIIQSKRGGTHG